MQSRILVFLLGFLLLAMQQETQVHALTHAGQALQQADDKHFQLPGNNASCALCGLLASGSSAIPGGSPAVREWVADAVAVRPATSAFFSSPHHPYRSRAPPPLL